MSYQEQHVNIKVFNRLGILKLCFNQHHSSYCNRMGCGYFVFLHTDFSVL